MNGNLQKKCFSKCIFIGIYCIGSIISTILFSFANAFQNCSRIGSDWTSCKNRFCKSLFLFFLSRSRIAQYYAQAVSVPKQVIFIQKENLFLNGFYFAHSTSKLQNVPASIPRSRLYTRAGSLGPKGQLFCFDFGRASPLAPPLGIVYSRP